MATRLGQAENLYANHVAPLIEAAVSADPELMERVYERKWGNLNTFFDHGLFYNKLPAVPVCGCLVGSMAIENGSTDWSPLLGILQLTTRLGVGEEVIVNASMTAPHIAKLLGSNEKGVEFIKAKLRAVLDWHQIKTQIKKARSPRPEPVAV